MRHALTGTLLIVAMATACKPKAETEGAAPSATDTSAATQAPGALVDSASAPPTSVELKVKDSTASKARTQPARTGTVVGRDSAFGPTYTVDSTGKVTPIVPAKKKP